MSKILIIEDDQKIRAILKEILEEKDHDVEEAGDGQEGYKKLEQGQFDLCICDIKMPKMDGLEVLEKAKENGIGANFIVISAHGTIDVAVEAVKKGAFDFLQKPFDLGRLEITLRNALDKSSLVKETKTLKKKISRRFEMIGESAPIVHVKEMIEKVAQTDARVLVTGPNGSGKELVSRWIHEKSKRANGPLVEVNCAAIPSELIESELFGHEKGSFTSAIKQRLGKFELAEGGTLFLDEIGDMSLSAQAKVLRALQENKITRVGGDKEISVNVRVIAATNKDLRKEIDANQFREDLYHRLSVIVIKVPALNERKEDIGLLSDKFLDDIAEEYGARRKSIQPAALEKLKEHNWTGNIRELRNVIERLVIMSGDEVTAADVAKYL
ncbi:DNA-binding transcriptional response regulator, NtrC family, contains REC, AAA-type ATPase, and a Fis-type DNA-binding domains [Chryseolinea serpens]|uniref:DNA-binding transcriptional response regulator, NtrC family, contains REC, AAA-type ATPase, and a Fis-type DNA-binding domains n=1 Tax=Chryseolinea serpens TaxID=947013 RepID=A0A1M5U3P4_9BACT|nr:sigma-54 dependent transcriptional regulator [Chryseolinea serpens]SHH57725.1 DNA-binding transcriptional response regulator, NtrC family, contains REC, AAA-type ATPase, and a Fis-type DNA-binding domains [Chryseolinea serpens]